MTSSSGIPWDVVLPDRSEVAFGRKRPKATLVIGQRERRFIPKAVGKRLVRLQKEHKAFSSRDELLACVKDLERSMAHDRMEELINLRDYSSAELAQKLKDDGYPEGLAQEIVSRAEEVGIVDNLRFAQSYIRTKMYAGWGRARIVRELRRKGIDADGVEGLEAYLPEDEDEYERAYDLAARRRLTGKNDYQKLMRFLVGRGFSPSVSSNVTKRVLDEAREED